ncbi:LysR family transcriptional regulator [Paenibacillus sp. P96]|uniref:LysR family transcriptional regulator n=1 Tax=Paenibacillus zeirhizosphaerae TaxID=2987519 RepID=A0ABT9FSC0_9BACL|nr:LysR family transcriptional regulator [Paenibacillus sp. P96]MDP4097634.1 LysR family transcriptional regulator [Paenibacillus sp. P96]
MDIGVLKVFRTVAEEGSISKAAHKLNYVQSNVTARMQQLEQELKTPLFYRHSRGITLTSAGQTLLEYTEKILNLLEEAEKAVVDTPIPKGSITVGSDTTSAVRLPVILSAYRGKFPEVEVHLEIGRNAQLINAVLQYSINGALVDGPVEHPEIVQELVINERLGLIIPEGMDFQGLTSIQDMTLMLLNEDCIYRHKLEEWLRDEGFRLAKVMQFGTMEGLLGCVKAGIGFSILPVSYFDKMNVKDGIRYYFFPERYGEVPVVFIRRHDLYMTSAFRKFIEELKAQLLGAISCGEEAHEAYGHS